MTLTATNTIQFRNVDVDFSTSTMGPNGQLHASSSVNFENSVASATAAIQGFTVSYDKDDLALVSVVGASVSNIFCSNNQVSFDVSVQLYDGGKNPHHPANSSSVTVTVIACCNA